MPAPVVESGSFTHGFCADCQWQGPGRRARSMAVEDAQLHALTCGGATREIAPEPSRRADVAGSR